MSLDPRDSRRRDRSRSPGGMEPRDRSRVDEGRERERSRVRVPSPPTARYEDDRRDHGYGYDDEVRDRSSRVADVVTAEPSYGQGKYADPYAMPGAYEVKEDKGSRSYGEDRGTSKPEQDYYAKGSYGASRTGGRNDEYGRSEPERHRYSPDSSTYKYADTRDHEKEYKEKMERAQKESSKKYEEERHARERGPSFNASAGSHMMSGGIGGGHDYEKPKYGTSSSGYPPLTAGQYPPPPTGYSQPPTGYSQPSSEYSKPSAGYAPPPAGYAPPPAGYAPPSSGYGPPSSGYPPVTAGQYPPGPGAGGYPYPSSSGPEAGKHPSLPAYMEPKQWEYAQPNENITYTKRHDSYDAKPASPPHSQYSAKPDKRDDKKSSRHRSKSYTNEPSARSSASNVVTVEPGSRNRRERSRSRSPPAGLAYGALPGSKKKDSRAPLGPRTHSLSVSTGHHGSATMSLANAPGSPLLEAYQGTYQSIGAMPSPLMIANHPHSDGNIIEALSPLTSDDEDHRGSKKSRRTARFHDPKEEAVILAKALKGSKRGPDIDPLIEILPGLTHEQVLDLRVEYKKIVKTGSEKKGVNIAKHIKMQLKDEDPNLMKACYTCALGKWESEAYWANFWYQGEKSRRELLIESLFGRTNREIRAIKDGFSDKKYSDSLTKCMRTELKEDKFKRAVLLALDEKKMEDRGGVDRDLVQDDVRDLYKALRSERGGETIMISIIVVRSDAHLREVLRVYEGMYRTNFAREMLKRSGNLVVSLPSFSYKNLSEANRFKG